jgi:DNA-directed RNA polymerase specialized sigma24 family protein
LAVRTVDFHSGLEAHRQVFATTHWSVVLAAGHASSPEAESALERLCRSYWYPLYAHVRRRGYSPEDAQDLTQEFFARLLAKQWLNMADARRGRFRTFLLAALDHYLAHEWERARCKKRGGGMTVFSLDVEGAEARYHLEPADRADAAWLYERRWALTLLDRVLHRLGEEFTGADRKGRFEQLQPYLLGDKTGQTYADLAAVWQTTEAAVKMSVSRMRRRYRELFLEEIAQTVSAPEEVEAEVRHLRAVLVR